MLTVSAFTRRGWLHEAARLPRSAVRPRPSWLRGFAMAMSARPRWCSRAS